MRTYGMTEASSLSEISSIRRFGNTQSSRGLFAEAEYNSEEELADVVMQIQGNHGVKKTIPLMPAAGFVFDKSVGLALPR